MKKLLKKMKEAVMLLKENAIPIMSFFIVILAFRPYCYSIRGYHAIGGEYILAGLVAYAVHIAQSTMQSEEDDAENE